MPSTMTRRGLFGRLLGAIGLGSLGSFRPMIWRDQSGNGNHMVAGDGQVFDWRNGTVTDERFAPLAYGTEALEVLLDGIECGGDVVSCRTGKDGIVWFAARGPGGGFETRDGWLVSFSKRGNVQVVLCDSS